MIEHSPALDIDPFSDEFLADLYPFHEALREAGPVVWLASHGVFAAARHADVQSALQDWRTFSSAVACCQGGERSDVRRGRPRGLK